MKEPKYSVPLTLDEWNMIIEGLGETEKKVSQIKTYIITDINNQVIAINKSIENVQEETNENKED
nr:MAG TPA: hypothetical protein [Caudoviricetes sp.]